MKELRAALLIFFSLVTARMLAEGGGALGGCLTLDAGCQQTPGLIVSIPFVLSAYFIDSLIAEYASVKDKKTLLLTLLFCVPYLVLALVFTSRFFSTLSLVSVEYIFSNYFLPVVLVYAVLYWLNSHAIVRKVNKIFMVTFLISVFIFQFI